MTLKERLQRARKAAKFATAKEAALKNHWNYATYKSAESGRRPPSRDNIAVYAKAFGVGAEWLWTGRGAMHPDEKQIPILDWKDITGPGDLLPLLNAANPVSYTTASDGMEHPPEFFVPAVDLALYDPTKGRLCIWPGSLLGISRTREPFPGCIALIKVGGLRLIRRLRELGPDDNNGGSSLKFVVGSDTVRFVAYGYNDDFPKHQIDRIAVEGVVVEIRLPDPYAV